jgi:hypothetical protein
MGVHSLIISCTSGSMKCDSQASLLALTFASPYLIVVTYEIRVFFEGAEKEVFSSIFKKTL